MYRNSPPKRRVPERIEGCLNSLYMVSGLIFFAACIVFIVLYFIPRQMVFNRLYSGKLEDVCQGIAHEGYPSYQSVEGIHRAIAFRQADGVLLEAYIPEAAQAKNLDEIELVLCTTDFRSYVIETCNYTSGGFIKRYRGELDVALFEAATGKLVASETIFKESNRCPAKHSFATGTPVIENKVNTVDSADVREWVRQYLIIENNP
jgi:hypothetical protein